MHTMESVETNNGVFVMRKMHTEGGLIDQLIQSLNQFERHVLLLYYVEGLSPMEIGEVLEVSGQRIYATISDLKQRSAKAMVERYVPIATVNRSDNRSDMTVERDADIDTRNNIEVDRSNVSAATPRLSTTRSAATSG